MKGKLLIVFKSIHGYTRRYVDILGNALGCDAVPADKFKPVYAGTYDKILYIGSVRGNRINGFKKFGEYLGAFFDKFVLCGVGMLPFSKEICTSLKEANVSVTYEKLVPVFYAQGGFDVKELSRSERLSFGMVLRQIQMGNFVSETDSFIINANEMPFDEVKIEHIRPLIDFLDGKTVDEELFSPAELTDPKDIAAHFAELQPDQPSTDDERRRALKKKLKK